MTGVAPDVKIMSYRVFTCPTGDVPRPTCSSDDVIAAISRAVSDGADIINLSLGGPAGWAGEPEAIAVDNAKAKGKAVFISAGNDGSQGPLYASNPAAAKTGISVGAYKNQVFPQWRFQLKPSTDSPFEQRVSFWYTGKIPINLQSDISWSLYEPTFTTATCPEIVPNPAINGANVMLALMPPGGCNILTYFEKLRALGVSPM